MKQLNVTELDFDKIKSNLRDYLKELPGGEYQDWDFEGSGLNQLLDVLAYNTHYNAILAHNTMNESFIDSAQIRGNVVSRAKLLGYVPRSVTAPKATLSITFPGDVNESRDTYSITSGLKFTTTVDDVTYTFITIEDYTTQLDVVSDSYTFPAVEIYQGRIKHNKYVVDEATAYQNFEINDTTIDISQLSVDVYDNNKSNSFKSYTRFDQIGDVGPESAVYFIQENYDNHYEVSFGDNVFGKKPDALNIIDFKYLSTLGADANNATIFEWAGIGASPLSISTISKASGGTSREGVESIRFNAPLSFIAQNRTVTIDDYKSIIGQNITGIQSLSVWGGQDNDPPEFGKVFISAKPVEDDLLTEQTKSDILDLIKTKKVIAILPKIVDPTFTRLYFDVLFKYDSNRTSLSQGQLETKVREAIEEFNTEELQRFDGVFRSSQMLSLIDNTDFSILNSVVRVFVYKTLNIVYANLAPTQLNFDMTLYGDEDEEEPLMSSDPWEFGGFRYRLGDERKTDGSSGRNVYAYRESSTGERIKVYKSLGTLFIKEGTLSLNALPVSQNESINIYVSPSSNDIVSKRNNLLSIDIQKTFIGAEVDAIAVAGSSGAIDYNTFNRQR
jgi:hypothetical protein